MKIGEVWVEKNKNAKVIITDIIDIYLDNGGRYSEIDYFYINDSDFQNVVKKENDFINSFGVMNNEAVKKHIKINLKNKEKK